MRSGGMDSHVDVVYGRCRHVAYGDIPDFKQKREQQVSNSVYSDMQKLWCPAAHRRTHSKVETEHLFFCVCLSCMCKATATLVL